ncbi:isochorismate synthase [Flavobacterium degerlachei]|jgi:isochorismate synthase|uniref:isochorismate synthase n=1 Tax=Flavobacterium degerlachei TaxID=229203 RepID=A0A1H2SFL0_9FLAO|nr:isochorismate synthase [Flavobacterium degerlachei]SDW29769.1 isochorismate synthase [Flavobacterium degerlachei]
MIDFFIKVKQQESQNLPFVIYRKPSKTKLIGLFQKNDHLYFAEDFKETGFVFAPFNGNQNILIPKKESVLWEAELTAFKGNCDANIEYPENNKDQEHFESLVQKGVDATASGVFKKVVLSRKEIIDLPNFDLVSVFKKLIYSYPDAFCYCWYHPKIGLWIGATPERLLKASKKKFFTMALAGTQNYEDTIDVAWEKKEIEEQQFVTDFILDNIKTLTREVAISSPYTLKAGGVLHIKTDIEGKLNKDSNMKQVVSVLHPTPAVCGLPKESSRNFILENEKYDREYYTGFLGEINKKEFSKDTSKTDLYVNLRCMQITNKEAHLYVGCGITKDSIPENEWKESVNKSMTMKRVL